MKKFWILRIALGSLARAWLALDAFLNPCAPPPDPSGYAPVRVGFHEKLFLQ
ncbi:MAG TPA: hypothetical protein VEJ41_06915 [Candidatus Acidoferrales bacterium]|nr:hypothetical protein [Candidatus Acidoferrales bacterium]